MIVISGGKIMSKYYFHLYMLLQFPNFLQKVLTYVRKRKIIKLSLKGQPPLMKRTEMRLSTWLEVRNPFPCKWLFRAPSIALRVMPVADLHLHKPSALLGLLSWGTSITHSPGLSHSNAASQGSLPVLICEFSRAGQNLGLTSISLNGARPADQHAGPTSKVKCPSACLPDWMFPKAEDRPGLHLLLQGQTQSLAYDRAPGNVC